MNIFYDNTIFYIQKRGGVSRYFTEIIKRIADYGNVNVAALKRPNLIRSKLIRFNNIFIKARLAVLNYDIYHPTYYSNAVTKRKNTKVVVTVFDMIHELFSARFKELAEGIDIKKRSIFNADHIICISNATKRDLERIYGIKGDRISVVYLGVFLDGNKPSFEKFKKPVKPYILYIGKRHAYKNFNTLLDAFYRLKIEKNYDLLCYGGGYFSDMELSKFKKLGLENSVKYAQGPDELLNFCYQNASVFVLPSLYEGFGLPLLEAMANRCPVVASNAGSIPEVAQNAALLFSPENTDELCFCIDSMLRSSNLRNEYINKGSAIVRNFTWENTARQTYQVYEKVLNVR